MSYQQLLSHEMVLISTHQKHPICHTQRVLFLSYWKDPIFRSNVSYPCHHIPITSKGSYPCHIKRVISLSHQKDHIPVTSKGLSLSYQKGHIPVISKWSYLTHHKVSICHTKCVLSLSHQRVLSFSHQNSLICDIKRALSLWHQKSPSLAHQEGPSLTPNMFHLCHTKPISFLSHENGIMVAMVQHSAYQYNYSVQTYTPIKTFWYI